MPESATRFTPRNPDSPPVRSVQRNAMEKPSAVKASVRSEKYTPRRRSTRNPTANPRSVVAITAKAIGATMLPLNQWICASAAA